MDKNKYLKSDPSAWVAFTSYILDLNCISTLVQTSFQLRPEGNLFYCVSYLCWETAKKKKKMFGIKFFWNKEKKKSNFCCLSEHGLWGTGLGEQRTIRWKYVALSQNINHLGDADIEFYYCAGDSWGCQRELCSFFALDVAGLAAIAHEQITSEERGGGLEAPGRRSSWGNIGRGRSTRSAESGGRSAGGGGGVGGWESCASRPRIHSSAEAEHRQHTPYVNRCWQMQSMLAAALWLALLGREDHNIACVPPHFLWVWLCL